MTVGALREILNRMDDDDLDLSVEIEIPESDASFSTLEPGEWIEVTWAGILYDPDTVNPKGGNGAAPSFVLTTDG